MARMNLKELRAATRALGNLDRLGGFLGYEGGGSLHLAGGAAYNGMTSLPIDANDFAAVIGLLMERNEQVLIGLDLEIEE